MNKEIIVGKVRDCCARSENLEVQPSNKPDLVTKKCKVCDRNHYRLMVEGAKFN